MMLSRFAMLRWAALLSAAVLAGCAPSRGLVPFQTYTASFTKVVEASEALIDRVAVAERQEARHQFTGPSATSIEFQDFRPTQYAYYATGVDPPLAAASRRAIGAVATYNATLLALAEGKGLDDLKAGAGRFGAEIAGLLALVGATPTFAPLTVALKAAGPAIDLALQAASRAAFEDAFLKHYGTVDAILELLGERVADNFEAKLTAGRRDALSISGRRAHPVSDEQVARLRAEIEAADTAVYDWIALIAQARAALAATKAALTSPVSPAIRADELAETAARIRVLAASVKSALMQFH